MDLKQAILGFYQTSARYLLGPRTPDVCDKSKSVIKFDVKGRAVRVYYRKKSQAAKRAGHIEEEK